MPDYDMTIASGETTLKSIEYSGGETGREPKGVSSSFADRLFDRSSSPSGRPGNGFDLLAHAETFGKQRLLLGWFKDADDQQLATRSGFDGAVRRDAGDYLYRSTQCCARFQDERHRHAEPPPQGRPRSVGQRQTIRSTSPGTTRSKRKRAPRIQKHRRWGHSVSLGCTFGYGARRQPHRVCVRGDSLVKLTAPALVANEAGRAVIGTYLDGATRQHETPICLDQSCSRSRSYADRRDLPPDHPEATWIAARAGNVGDPGTERLPHSGRQAPAFRFQAVPLPPSRRSARTWSLKSRTRR